MTALVKRLPTIFQISGQTRNCGSSSEPVSGMSTSITPFLSFSSAIPRRTGSRVAVGLSTFSPSVNWSITTWFCASSFPCWTR